MLVESRLNDKTTLLIDCESVGGIAKGDVGASAHPDRILSSAVDAIRSAAAQLGNALAVEALPAPVCMELSFAVRVDSNAVVSIAQTPEHGQFRVVLRWDG